MPEIKKKLYRSKKDKIIGGVCGGIGNHLNTDPTIIRVIWVLGSFLLGIGLGRNFFWWAGLFAYLIAWIIIPEEK